ncbi:unnamed protein product [Linum trigynum]|uniref:Helitron helicase-like domain-containing protein n=1 Tax=Linum trigynum TaxID=586398 RepID=A0AAV2CHD2_9ROSI
MLDQHNQLVKTFRRVRQQLQDSSTTNLKLRIFGAKSRNRQYDLPSSTEIAALIPGFSIAVAKVIRLFGLEKLFSIFVFDAYSSIELNMLAFLRYHQPQLRCEVYQGLQDAMARGDLDRDKMGHIVLPGTYIGSPRYMQQLYHDAMAAVEFFGNPDLFITFTYKPKVVSRVFHAKLSILIDDIKKNSYFGKTIATEISDPQQDLVGYEAVCRFMLHGPCGEANTNAPCMRDKKKHANGKCSKQYPKDFNSTTTLDKFGNVVYRRSNTGVEVQKGSSVLDNRHVVPYNRNLLIRMQAHINVEVCHKGKLIKYLFKYVTKGPERSLVIAENADASQIIQKCNLRGIEQKVTYKKQSNVRNVLGNPNVGKTHLTEWFALNRRDPQARVLTYAQIPNNYTWLPDCKEWNPRKKGFVIGRVAYVPPGSGDVFFLRMILTKVRGALSYAHLRTVNGELCPDFEKACEKLCLLSDTS